MGFTILDLTMYKPKTYGSFELSAKKRATSPPRWEEPNEVAVALNEDASCTPIWWGVPGLSRRV